MIEMIIGLGWSFGLLYGAELGVDDGYPYTAPYSDAETEAASFPPDVPWTASRAIGRDRPRHCSRGPPK